MQDPRDVLTPDNLLEHFPWEQHSNMLPNQRESLEFIARHKSGVTIEATTGSGKTAVGYTLLRTLVEAGFSGWYITPTKVLVDQVKSMFPGVTQVYGRNEYDCLYYEPELSFKADEIPCLSLDCKHRVDQETGQTQEPGVQSCPYYLAKYNARQSGIVVCTMAFYLYNFLFQRDRELPTGLVVDEAHQIAKVFRNALSYEITDWHLSRSVALLNRLGEDEAAGQLEDFALEMVKIIRSKPAKYQQLLKDEEVERLLALVKAINATTIRKAIRKAVSTGKIDPVEDRELLKRLEELGYNLVRYVHSLEFSLATKRRYALSYVTYAYTEREPGPRQKVLHKLVIRSHYVANLVNLLMPPIHLAQSATIGDNEVFGWETGITNPYLSLPSGFSSDNARVIMPINTPDLAAARRIKAEPAKVLRRIAKLCGILADRKVRSLVVVVSETERLRFMQLCKEEGVDAVTYGNGTSPKQAVASFKNGAGSVLVGTMAHFGEGIDLPDEIAPVIFVLRPAYPNPKSPEAQFEQRRFGGRVWAVWNWRVMIEALQVRGRNIRSTTDRGVTVFISQHFRKFLYNSLPTWLKEAYRRDLTLEDVVGEILELLEDEAA